MGKMEKSLILNSYIRRRKCNEKQEVCEKKKKQEALRRVSIILRKCETLRTSEESRILESATDIVKQILTRKNRQLQSRERVLEKEDPQDVIEGKARKLAEVISRARHLVCYTGAGISTSARIPDYRGSQGIWTLLQQGKDIGQYDLSLAEPTYTHMALYELHRRNILRYVLSQNCDGLHLRSGLPRKSLSEVHGNMYVEVCKNCKPNCEYWRLFDTTEFTARYYHKTNRRCHLCGTPLVDTIVHFGERGSLKWPLNWDGAIHHADKADVILCMGSSLKVLKKYPWLWSMDRPRSKRPKIYIVNLQWTPKDATATMKINGKCDEVMKLIMKYMNINVPEYDRKSDPIFAHASLLAPEELHTRSQPMLQRHKEVKTEDCEAGENENSDGTSETYDNGSDDSKDKILKPLPDLIPIVRSDIELLKSIKDCAAKETESRTEVVEKDDVYSSCDRLNKINLQDSHEDTTLTTADRVNTSENEENIKTFCSNNCEYSNGCDSSTDVQNSTLQTTNGSDCYEKTQNTTEDKLSKKLCPQIICDKETISDHPPPINPLSKSTVNLIPQNDVHDLDRIAPQPQLSDKDERINDRSSIKSPISTITSHDGILFKNDKDHYQHLLDYCKVIGHLPYWYDVNYAYSGLHSIIYPPPTEVDLWGSVTIPIFQLNRSDAECDFCFDNYAEYNCQFYRPKSTDFIVTSCRKGRRILCECCDYTDESDNENSLEYGDEKRAKLDSVDFIKDDKESVKIQAGWYGKGYRKMFRRKRRA